MFNNSSSDKSVRPGNTVDTLFLSLIESLWVGVAWQREKGRSKTQVVFTLPILWERLVCVEFIIIDGENTEEIGSTVTQLLSYTSITQHPALARFFHQLINKHSQIMKIQGTFSEE
jgi:hypothetical protein